MCPLWRRSAAKERRALRCPPWRRSAAKDGEGDGVKVFIVAKYFAQDAEVFIVAQRRTGA